MKIKFPNVTENFALNFINTHVVRNNKICELLNDSQDMYAWLRNEQQLNPLLAKQTASLKAYLETDQNIDEIRALRDEHYQQLVTLAAGTITTTAFAKEIEQELRQQRFTLDFSDHQKILVPAESDLNGFKALLLLYLHELVAHNELEKLSRCSNPDCILLFINNFNKKSKTLLKFYTLKWGF